MLSARKLFLSLTILCRLFQLSRGNNNCLIFKEGGDIIRGRPGTYKTLIFSVARSNCFPPQATRIDSVAIYNATSGEDRVYCQFMLPEGQQCHSLRSQDCHCLSEAREFSVTLPMNAEARCQTWKLVVGFEGTSQQLFRNVKLLIKNSSLYPPEVKGVRLQQQSPRPLLSPGQPLVVWPQSQVTVTCLWEEGSPPRPALLSAHTGSQPWKSRELISPPDGCLRHLQYVIGKVQCKDMAKITCHVPGATTSMFQVLLVKCAPQFTKANMTFRAQPSGGQLLLQFPVRVHERNITSCLLVRRFFGTSGSAASETSTIDSSEKTASRSVPCHKPELVGTDLPDLILRTWLTGVTSSPVEVWTVTLTNSVGTGSADFYVEIQREKPNRDLLAAAAIGCTAFCVLLAVILCLVQCARKGCTRHATYYQPALAALSAPRERPPQPYPRKAAEEHVDNATALYTACAPSTVAPDATDCDSCLIDRIYNEIKTHATHNP